jgi:hypothetical protein
VVLLALLSAAVLMAVDAMADISATRCSGSASNLVLSKSQAGYRAIGSSQPATPSPDKRLGLRSAWEASYSDPSPIAQADIAIYVYDSNAHADVAYRNGCIGCTTRIVKGIRIKYRSITRSGMRFVGLSAVCQNVYVGVVAGATNEEFGRISLHHETSVLQPKRI